MKPRIPIDTEFLLRQAPGLDQVKRKRRTWDEFGDRVVRELHEQSPKVRIRRIGAELAVVTKISEWNSAKKLVHDVMSNQNPEHDAVRRRLGDLRATSTPILFSTLSLWLAGALGISVSVTKPLVAAMLYGVAKAEGDWDVLES